ncbi:MAG: hypothetical protein L0212_07965 [Acidobacteria bacterium]|nr:hypothetical protein [Acidobacteriota bacterium]
MNQFAIESMSLELPAVARHPNRQPFRGVLTLVDVASERAPSGARGHRVILTRAAAESAIPSLLGMGLGYRPALDGHDARRKVGIITEAFVAPASPARAGSRGHLAPGAAGETSAATASETLALHVRGYLFARDFPEVVRELRDGGPAKAGLGMSYEIADARVADVKASIWKLTEVTFTGAAILRRSKAAYPDTWIELAPSTRPAAGLQAQARPQSGRQVAVSSNHNRKSAAPTLKESGRAMQAGVRMNEATTQQLIATTERLAAAAEALSDAAGRLETQHRELGAQQQTLDDKIGRMVAAIEDQGAASFTDLRERVAQLERENSELKTQASRISANSARKTLPPLVTALLSKSGVESADKIDAATLDKTLASLSVEQRIAVKAQMARAGIIE